MANSVVELLFKFITSGGAEIDKAAAGIDKLTTGAAKGSAPLDALGKSLDRAKKEAEGAGKSIDGLADKLRDGLNNPLQPAGAAVEGFVGKLGTVGIIAGGVAAGLGLVAKQAFDLVSAAGKAAEETVNLADRLDISANAAERLQGMAKIAGVNIGSLEGASRTLSAALEDSSGQGAKAAAALQKLGVNVVTTSGQLREPGPILLDMLDKLSQVESTSERVFLAQQVLPRGAAKELLPLIKNHKELLAAITDVGIGLDGDLTKNLSKADDAIDKLLLSIGKLRKGLAGAFAPIIIPVVVALTNALSSPKQSRPEGRGYDGSSQPDLDPALRLIDFSERRAAANAFKATRSNTEDGTKAKLAEINKQINELVTIVAADVNLDVRKIKEGELKKAEAEKASLEKRLEAFAEGRKKKDPKAVESAVARAVESFERIGVNELERFQKDLALKLSELEKQGASPRDIGRVRAAAGPEERRLVLDRLDEQSRAKTGAAERRLLGAEFAGLSGPGVLFSPSSDRREPGTAEDTKATFAAEMDSLKRKFDLMIATNDANLAAAIRLAELGNNEYDAAALVRDIKLSTAKTVLESRQAELDYTVRIAEIVMARLDKYKDTAAQVFRSIRQRGGGGVRDLLTGQLDIQGEKIFANVSGAAFQKAGSTLGRIGAAIPGGEKIFEGTIFDPKNQKPLDKNTASLESLTKSVDKLRTGISGGAPGGVDLAGVKLPGGGSLGDFASDLGGLTGGKSGGRDAIFGKLLGGKSTAVGGFFGGVGSVPGGLFRGVGGDFSVRTGDGSATAAGTAGRIGNVAGSAALVAAGVAGVISGIKEGGARGAVGGIGAALGVASAIPGPQQPFIASAAAIAALVKGLIPSAKESFDRDQGRVLDSRKFTGPVAEDRSYDFATGGDSIDADFRGRVRVTNNRPITINISAMDARSFLDRRDDIADAVGSAMDKGHPVGVSVQKVIFGQGG